MLRHHTLQHGHVRLGYQSVPGLTGTHKWRLHMLPGLLHMNSQDGGAYGSASAKLVPGCDTVHEEEDHFLLLWYLAAHPVA